MRLCRVAQFIVPTGLFEMKRSHSAALAILLLFGAARLRFEQQLTEEHRAAYFHGAKLNLGLRQKIGQAGFLAALSGFRSVVADLLWVDAHIAWERGEWGRMWMLFNNVVALQPRNVTFWDVAAWHMAWNASAHARDDPKQPREALRIKAEREYFQMGEDLLKRGIENNPDRYELYERLGTLYRDKFKDHCKAFENYDKAASFPNAPEYEKRLAVYELDDCPGHEREAYERLRTLYGSPWFSADDFVDLPNLLKKLCEHADPVSGFVWNEISDRTKKLLTDPKATAEQRRSALVEELNRILKGNSIYEEKHFAGVQLSPLTLGWKARNPQGKDLAWLNRLVLEDAYPKELRKSQREWLPSVLTRLKKRQETLNIPPEQRISIPDETR
jgi:tetratricopeptide (TPR) repeat protein